MRQVIHVSVPGGTPGPRINTRSGRAPSRRGFSLLEILLALALAVILITAIAAAVNQSWQLTAQGQTELQRQQVARAVFRLIERDLRSVMFVPPSEFADEDEDAASVSSSSGSSTSGSGGSSGSTSSTNLSSSSSQSVLVLASRGIRGDQSAIEVDGARPQWEIAFALPVNAAISSSRTSDLRTVIYQLVPPGVSGDPSGGVGLVRREGDRYAIATAEMMGQSAQEYFSSTAIAPEIIGLEFRYFDGVQWWPAWDSESAGRLPRAVEVQIQFAPPEEKKAAWLNAAINRSTESARVVIYLPAADPVPEEVTE